MNIERGKRYALNLLGVRMYTCSEVFERLLRKGAEKDDAELIVAELISKGILDDKEYAKCYIHDAASLSGKGAYRIRQELIKKGIAKRLIDEAFEESEASFSDGITEYARLKFGEDLEVSYKELDRIKNHLARRGYSYGEISDCLENLRIKASRSEEY